MNTIVIRRKDGSLLAKGHASSAAAYLEELVAEGVSLKDADLRDMDLDCADLSGADLSGAWLMRARLAGAVLKEVKLQRADLTEADLSGAEMPAVHANHAKFCAARLDGANMRGALLQRAIFRGACLDDADLCAGSLDNAVFTYASLRRTELRSAQMRNSDFGHSFVEKCDMRGADLHWGHRRIFLPSAPDRTRNAMILNNRYDKETIFCADSAGKFTADYRLSRIVTIGALGWSALAVGQVLDTISDGVSTSSLMTTVASLHIGLMPMIAGAIAVKFAFFAAENEISDRFAEYATAVKDRIWKAAAHLIQIGSSAADIMIMFGAREPLKSLARVLNMTTNNGAWERTKTVIGAVTATHDFLVCDRKHFAKAVASFLSNKDREYRLNEDIFLVRDPAPNEGPMPVGVRFYKSGDVGILWECDGEKAFALHPRSAFGAPRVRYQGDNEVLKRAAGESAAYSLDLFQAAMFADIGLSLGEFDPLSQHLEAGMDGSLLIINSDNRELIRRIEREELVPGQEFGDLDAEQDHPFTP